MHCCQSCSTKTIATIRRLSQPRNSKKIREDLTDQCRVTLTMELCNQTLSIICNNKLGTAIIAGSGLLLLVYALKNLTVKKYKLPPGPRPWPIVGNLPAFFSNLDSQRILEKYRKIHGDIFTFYLGSRAIVVLNGYQLIREAFITKGNDFAGRFAVFSSTLQSRGRKGITVGKFNPVWQVQRKILHGALRQYATGKHLEENLGDAFSVTCKSIVRVIDEGAFDPWLTTTLLMYNIISRIAFGKTYEQGYDEFKMAVEKQASINSLVGNGLLADYIPCLRYLPTPAVNKIKRNMAHIQAFIKRKWDEHNASYDQSCVSDLTFHIIKLREDLKESNEDFGALSQLTEEHYLEIISDFVLTATDTSRYTLVWVILYLAAHQEIQQMMQDEIDSAIGSREIKLSDRQMLPYTEAVLHEVMRLRTLAPMLLPHSTTCETSVAGYKLPPETPIIANVMSLHMDPSSFPEPDKFKPERFLDENGKFQSRPGEWMPFSAGRRVCVGESIAKIELHLLTAMLFQKFSFFPIEGTEIDLNCQELIQFMLPKNQKLSVKARY